jgi:hypothetical protein
MQTFLPYPDFAASAACLDYRRLGKQRVECLQILTALNVPTYGWQNHPAVRMWRGYDAALICYGLAVCTEWVKRGYNDTCFTKIHTFFKPDGDDTLHDCMTGNIPPWLGDNAFHASHRSNLLRKDPAHYQQFGWTEPSTLPYIWPLTN